MQELVQCRNPEGLTIQLEGLLHRLSLDCFLPAPLYVLHTFLPAPGGHPKDVLLFTTNLINFC